MRIAAAACPQSATAVSRSPTRSSRRCLRSAGSTQWRCSTLCSTTRLSRVRTSCATACAKRRPPVIPVFSDRQALPQAVFADFDAESAVARVCRWRRAGRRRSAGARTLRASSRRSDRSYGGPRTTVRPKSPVLRRLCRPVWARASATAAKRSGGQRWLADVAPGGRRRSGAAPMRSPATTPHSPAGPVSSLGSRAAQPRCTAGRPGRPTHERRRSGAPTGRRAERTPHLPARGRRASHPPGR
jgi:hypothetical protein